MYRDMDFYIQTTFICYKHYTVRLYYFLTVQSTEKGIFFTFTFPHFKRSPITLCSISMGVKGQQLPILSPQIETGRTDSCLGPSRISSRRHFAGIRGILWWRRQRRCLGLRYICIHVRNGIVFT